ncbi:MAG: superoxide dismutase family protein [Phycisphaeraceae bacterium]
MTRIMTRNVTSNLPAIFLILALALVPACGGGHDDHDHADGEHAGAFENISKAVCVLSPTQHTELTNVTGTITFTQTKDGLLVKAQVSGLKPNSKHGFHVHQFGDLTKADGTATGGHYNPGNAEKHSLPEDHEDHGHSITGGHAGDLGNLESDADGNATYEKTFANITLTGKNAVLGRGIIVHLDEDKGIDAQPTGGAGPRVAQGVIGIAQVEKDK